MKEKRPKINDVKTALQEIKRIASDKRKHLLKDDEMEWLETKLKECAWLATQGLKKCR